LLAVTLVAACQEQPKEAELRAFQVTNRDQIIGGGPRALGDLGDFVLQNENVRVVIQNAGFSRGFGVFGGGIIDADLRRTDESGATAGGKLGGHDIFAEMFPSFFFQAVACDKVRVLTDGTSVYEEKYGDQTLRYEVGTAVVRASGKGGEFLTMLKLFNAIVLDVVKDLDEVLNNFIATSTFEEFAKNVDALTNTKARFEIDYVLRPGATHVEIRSRMINQSTGDMSIPSPLLGEVGGLLGVDLSGLRVPIGTIMLFGLLNNVWMPGTGFDIRHPLERSFKRGVQLPAFGGLVTEFIASAAVRRGDGVSYGLVATPSENNFVNNLKDLYKDGFTPIDNTSMLVPFQAISFMGVFGDSVDRKIPAGGFVEQAQLFFIGNGDVASILDGILSARGTTRGRYEGQMIDTQTGEPISDGQVLIYQRVTAKPEDFKGGKDDWLDAGLRLCDKADPKVLCRPYSQDYPDSKGMVHGSLPPGSYTFRLQAAGRRVTEFTPFEIKADATTNIGLLLDPPARIAVRSIESTGLPLPAKVLAVGSYATPFTEAERRSGGAYEIQAGEPYMFTDMLDDKVDGQRRYIEAATYTDVLGKGVLTLRPGHYTLYFSRGFEYDIQTVEVDAKAGDIGLAGATLTRVVDTTGWISVDPHLHGLDSIDSNEELDNRLLSIAGEGLEVPIATDHNYITDYAPYIERLGLQRWVKSFIGIEFTTLEVGHFNAFPLARDLTPTTHGSFSWFGRPPQELFDELHARGAYGPDNTLIVQNHPRDQMQGTFYEFGLSNLDFKPYSRSMSDRLAGPSGPAFYDKDGHSTFSLGFDLIEVLNGKLSHEIRSFRVPPKVTGEWPAACYVKLPKDFDPKKQTDPCSLGGKVLRPKGADYVKDGEILAERTTGDSGDSGIANLEVIAPGVVDDWFHLFNLGHRFTGVGASDSHARLGNEAGLPRTYVALGTDDPQAVDALALVDALKRKHAATISQGPILTMTVAEGDGAKGGVPIGAELAAPSGKVTVNYRLTAAPWVSVSRIFVTVNGKLLADKTVSVDPNRDLANSPLDGQVLLSLDKDAWIVLDALGDKPMWPMVTGTEEPFLLISDAIGSLAGPLGIGGGINTNEMVVGNVRPYAITNPIWVRLGATWKAPGILPLKELNDPSQYTGIGAFKDRNWKP